MHDASEASGGRVVQQEEPKNKAGGT
jgi:hypothetical protein